MMIPQQYRLVKGRRGQSLGGIGEGVDGTGVSRQAESGIRQTGCANKGWRLFLLLLWMSSHQVGGGTRTLGSGCCRCHGWCWVELRVMSSWFQPDWPEDDEKMNTVLSTLGPILFGNENRKFSRDVNELNFRNVSSLRLSWHAALTVIAHHRTHPINSVRLARHISLPCLSFVSFLGYNPSPTPQLAHILHKATSRPLCIPQRRVGE